VLRSWWKIWPKGTALADLNDRLQSAAAIFAGMRTRRAGPRIGTLCDKPIHDFIENIDGSRWTFDGALFAGRVLSPSDIVHHQAVYSQVAA
jgi:hypothetical protein